MQQRQLRLGDILDDYCPRERRITNHAVVAMVGPDVKQTRCTTCDAEHPYKGGKIPPQRKKKDAKGALYDQVLAAASPAPSVPSVPPNEVPTAAPPQFEGAPDDKTDAAAAARAEEEGRAHRPLIRATLPRTGGQATTRPAPEFTVRQAAGTRHGKFHGHQTAGGHHTDRLKGRAQTGHGPGARVPGTRPGHVVRHASHSGHSSHGAGMHPHQHPHQSRHSHSAAMARPRNKRSR